MSIVSTTPAATWGWLRERSGLGELCWMSILKPCADEPLSGSDLLVRHRQPIEAALFSRITYLFSLPTTLTFFDLTNTSVLNLG